MTYNLELSRIQSFPKDNTLYLIEKLPGDAGVFASNGNLVYLVLNHEQCASMSIKTDYLNLDSNVHVTAFNKDASSFKDGYYNSIELDLTESADRESNLNAFLHLCFTHAKSLHGQSFLSFFDSLVSLFQLPKDQHYKNLIGLTGELLFIEYLLNNYGFDISAFWHTQGPSSQLDFVCPDANFEVKTSTSGSMCFTIKHDQLFSQPSKNHLVTVQIEENNSGRTLEEIIDELLSSSEYCNGLHFSINIEKEKRRISPSEMHNRRFILKGIKIYRAKDINLFTNIPDCVEDLTYQLDLLPFDSVPFIDIANIEHV